jgi:hypothetical protein
VKFLSKRFRGFTVDEPNVDQEGYY